MKNLLQALLISTSMYLTQSPLTATLTNSSVIYSDSSRIWLWSIIGAAILVDAIIISALILFLRSKKT